MWYNISIVFNICKNTTGKGGTLMSDFILTLQQIFENSGVAVTVTDENFDVVWENKRAVSDRHGGSKNMRFIFGGAEPKTGMTYMTADGVVCSYNVMKTENAADGKAYYIIELTHKEKLTDAFTNSAVRSFISFICVRIRKTLGDISSCSDNIFGDISKGIVNLPVITKNLNGIDESIMTLAKEVVQPEMLYWLIDSDDYEDDARSLDYDLERLAFSVQRTLGSKIRVKKSCEKDMYYRMDKSVFEAVISGMTAECCAAELIPETFEFSARRTDSTKAEITIKSVNTSGEKNDKYERDMVSTFESMKLNPDLIFGYVREFVSRKYGVVFTRITRPDGLTFKMELNILPEGFNGVSMNRKEFIFESGETVSTMALSLAYFHAKKKYVYTLPANDE